MPDLSDRRSIFVVDDSLDYLRFIEMLLGAEGFAVTTLESVNALEHALAGRKPDLVITDVRLPGSDPFAVIDRLRARADTAEIPVLVCTGAVNELAQRRDRLEREGIEILTKPFDVDALLLRIAALLPDAHAPSPL